MFTLQRLSSFYLHIFKENIIRQFFKIFLKKEQKVNRGSRSFFQNILWKFFFYQKGNAWDEIEFTEASNVDTAWVSQCIILSYFLKVHLFPLSLSLSFIPSSIMNQDDAAKSLKVSLNKLCFDFCRDSQSFFVHE